MVKFLHTSDWQIGMKGSGLGAAASLVAEQRIQTLERVLDLAQSEHVDFVVACGDLFEHNQVADDQVTAVARILRAYPSVEVHAIPGNHDLPGPGSVWNRAALRGVPNLHPHVTAEPVPTLLRNGVDYVVLHPFPVLTRHSHSDPLVQLQSLSDDALIHIGLAHGHILKVTFGAHESEIKLPIDPEHVDGSGLDYLALGHWHGTRLFGTRIAYSGTHEQSSYGESDAGNILIVSIVDKGAPPEIRAVRVGQLRWDHRELSFAGDDSIVRLRDLLSGCEADFLELVLDGELPDRVYEDYRDAIGTASKFKHLRLGDTRLQWIPDTGDSLPILSDLSLAEVQRRLAELANTQDAEVVREAKRLLGQYAQEAGL